MYPTIEIQIDQRGLARLVFVHLVLYLLRQGDHRFGQLRLLLATVHDPSLRQSQFGLTLVRTFDVVEQLLNRSSLGHAFVVDLLLSASMLTHLVWVKVLVMAAQVAERVIEFRPSKTCVLCSGSDARCSRLAIPTAA